MNEETRFPQKPTCYV